MMQLQNTCLVTWSDMIWTGQVVAVGGCHGLALELQKTANIVVYYCWRLNLMNWSCQ